MPHRFRSHSKYCSGLALGLLLLCSHLSSATTLKLAWNASSDPDVVGYKLAYGTTSGSYTNSVDAGNSTSADVSLTPGSTYFLVVFAYNSFGLASVPSNEVAFSLPNIPPSVSLTAPQAGTYDGSSSIALTATASDQDGAVVKVEFYRDTTKIGESANSPYSSTWTNPSSGDYTLTALAYDDSGAAVRSIGVAITVSATSTGATPTPTPTPSPSPSPVPLGKVKVMAMTPLIKAGQTAKFKITASDGVQAVPMLVNYALSGTATAGVNYAVSGTPGQITIPAGSRGVMMPLTTMSVPGSGSKTIIVTIMPGSGYTPGRGDAVVKVLGR